MFIVESYSLAIVFCFVTMLCWGSWGNTQKLAQKSWRYELFYWDYVIGMVLAALLLGLTMGSTGDAGRSFLADLGQASGRSIGWVVLGGVIFNASNILLSASTALAGMSVAFPLGVGLALVLGVVINYAGQPSGNPVLLFAGVALVVAAIVCNGIASGMHQRNSGTAAKTNTRGLLLAAAAGILMSFFFRCVVKGMAVDNFAAPTPGMMTPYSAIFVFSLGVLASNLLFNTLVMRVCGRTRPLRGIFRRHGQDPRRRHAGRRHLVLRLAGKLHRLGPGRNGHLLRTGAGRHDGGGVLGRLHLARIPGRHAPCEPAHRADVRAVPDGAGADYPGRQLTTATLHSLT